MREGSPGFNTIPGLKGDGIARKKKFSSMHHRFLNTAILPEFLGLMTVGARTMENGTLILVSSKTRERGLRSFIRGVSLSCFGAVRLFLRTVLGSVRRNLSFSGIKKETPVSLIGGMAILLSMTGLFPKQEVRF